MKCNAAFIAVSLAILATAPAHAISEKYRAQLEREHKTQVEDTGSASAPKHSAGTSKVAQAQKYFDDAVVGSNIGESADMLMAKGWKPNNGFWIKGGVAVQLEVSDNGEVSAAHAMAN